MKKRIQGLVAGLLIGCTLTGGVSFAKQATEWVQLAYNNIKISLNGNEVKPTDADGNYVEPFVINGTTYLPVRAVANALGLSVGWDDATKTVMLGNGNAGNAEQQTGNQFVINNISGLEVLRTYEWDEDDDHYIGLVIRNGSDRVVSPYIIAHFRDAYGNEIDDDMYLENAFGSGSECLAVFHSYSDYASVDFDISASFEDYYAECASKLETKAYLNGDKLYVSITNNGSKAAQFPQYEVLFKKSGSVVKREWGFCIDEDDEIKPGATVVDENWVLDYFEYDEVEVYVISYAYED